MGGDTDKKAAIRGYMHDPMYLERRFGVASLDELCMTNDVIGAARLTILPSFAAESIVTLIYRVDCTVSLEVADAGKSLSYSLPDRDWPQPKTLASNYPASGVAPPFQGWATLRAAAERAPSVTFAVIGGQRMATLDGVSYRHHIRDRNIDLRADWRNPTERAINHSQQVALLKSYQTLLSRPIDVD